MVASGSLLSHGMAKWALFVGSLFVIWFGGWYVVANIANSQISEQFKTLSARGLDVTCTQQEIKGFPFRLGLYCSKIDGFSKQHELQVQTGSLSTAAQIYAPHKVVAELDSPLALTGSSGSLDVSWTLMRGFVHSDFDTGFELLSITHDNLQASFNGGAFSSESGNFHFRPSPNEASGEAQPSLDFAGQIENLTVDFANGLKLPETMASIDGTLVDGYADLIVDRRPMSDVLSDGAEFLFRMVEIETSEGGRLVATGPIILHPDGLISGTITVGADNVASLAKWATQIDPEFGGALSGLAPALITMGQRRDVGGKSISTISVQINKGRARVGFFQLGEIPPVIFSR